MRTAAERKRRRIMYRVISVVFILAGVAKAIATMLDLHSGRLTSRFPQMDEAFIWFVLAGTWVAISRVWGELADEAAAREQMIATVRPQ